MRATVVPRVKRFDSVSEGSTPIVLIETLNPYIMGIRYLYIVGGRVGAFQSLFRPLRGNEEVPSRNIRCRSSAGKNACLSRRRSWVRSPSVSPEKLLELCSRCKFGVKTFAVAAVQMVESPLALKMMWRLW